MFWCTQQRMPLFENKSMKNQLQNFIIHFVCSIPLHIRPVCNSSAKLLISNVSLSWNVKWDIWTRKGKERMKFPLLTFVWRTIWYAVVERTNEIKVRTSRFPFCSQWWVLFLLPSSCTPAHGFQCSASTQVRVHFAASYKYIMHICPLPQCVLTLSNHSTVVLSNHACISAQNWCIECFYPVNVDVCTPSLSPTFRL